MSDDKEWKEFDVGKDPEEEEKPEWKEDTTMDGVLKGNKWTDKEKRVMVNVNVGKIWKWLKRNR